MALELVRLGSCVFDLPVRASDSVYDGEDAPRNLRRGVRPRASLSAGDESREGSRIA